MKYNLHLNDVPFQKIKEGTKTIEMRLNDEKRKLYKIGDELEFQNRKTNEILFVKIINIYKFDSFAEIYENFDTVKLGYEKFEKASPKDMNEFYSLEEQEKYGVLAIEIKVIKEK